MNISSAFHSTLKVHGAAANLDSGRGSVVGIQKLKDRGTALRQRILLKSKGEKQQIKNTFKVLREIENLC